MHWSSVAGHRKRMVMIEYQVKSLQIKSAQYGFCQCTWEEDPKKDKKGKGKEKRLPGKYTEGPS